MTRTGRALLLSLLLPGMALSGDAAADLRRGFENYTAIIDGEKSFADLSAEEIEEVIEIRRRLNAGLTPTDAVEGPRSPYRVEAVTDGEVLTINGVQFVAKSFCLGWYEGDHVSFLEGSANGRCASARLRNLRTNETCEVWCR